MARTMKRKSSTHRKLWLLDTCKSVSWFEKTAPLQLLRLHPFRCQQEVSRCKWYSQKSLDRSAPYTLVDTATDGTHQATHSSKGMDKPFSNPVHFKQAKHADSRSSYKSSVESKMEHFLRCPKSREMNNTYSNVCFNSDLGVPFNGTVTLVIKLNPVGTSEWMTWIWIQQSMPKRGGAGVAQGNRENICVLPCMRTGSTDCSITYWLRSLKSREV